MTRKHVRRWAFSLLPIAAACGDSDALGPEGDFFDAFVESMDVEGLQEIVLSSDAQIEVELLPGGMTAGLLAVRGEGRSGEERIQSRIVALDPAPGSLTLLLGELTVSVAADTRFWIGGDEVGREHFFAEVQGALEAGTEPPVVVERPVPNTPQDPEDTEFVASAVALTGEGTPSLRVNIDADNLVLVAEPNADEPDGWLTVFGLRIQLRVRDGTTELESHHHDFEELEDFEGVVQAANVDAGTFTLGDGVVVRIVDRTQIAEGDALLASLAAVAEALEAQHTVVAWGVGVVEGREPLRVLGLKVAFKVHEVDEPLAKEFEGVVASVGPDLGSLELGDGTVVRVVDGTELIAADDASPHSMAGVRDALEGGLTVVASGSGQVESEAPLVLQGLRIVFKIRHEEAPGHAEFEGAVGSVDLEGGAFVLEDGTRVRVLDVTEVLAYDDRSPGSLEEVAQALASGRKFVAWGAGELESTEPRELAALRVVFRSVIEDFEQDVATVDVDGGRLVLESGWVVHVGSDTELSAADDISPGTLQEASEALMAGDRVRAWGWGFVVGQEPIALDAVSVTMRRIPVG